MLKPSAPWHYLFWKPSNATPDVEVAFAQLTRREGFFFMLRLYWLIVPKESDSGRKYYDHDSALIFLSQNYPPFLCLLGYYIGLEDCGLLAMLWFATFAYGSLRYLAWLVAILFRWPPLAR